MATYNLKRGNSRIQLEKSNTMIALKANQFKTLDAVVKSIVKESTISDKAEGLGGFQILTIDPEKYDPEKTLNEMRNNEIVEVGSHVYTTPKSNIPFVPTGKITIRFRPAVDINTQNEIFDYYKLQVLSSRVKENMDGIKKETYIVGVTSASEKNPLKISAELQERENIIELAEPDLATPGKLKSFSLPTDDLLKEQWHLENKGIQFGTQAGLIAGADARVVEAWQLIQSFGSQDCIIAVIDDGFDLTHPDFSFPGKIVAPWDFERNINNPVPKNFHPQNGDWHGTACAGVALAASTGKGVVGAAPECRLMPLRWGVDLSDDSIEEWFAYVSMNGASIVSCSWGALAPSYVLSTRQFEAIEDCATKGRNGLGCVIVFAAGNDNHNINDPSGDTIDGFAIHPNVISVAASNSRDKKADYSNFGNEITVCAPSSGAGGRGILTTDVRGQYKFGGHSFESGYDKGDYTQNFGGTSSAAPLVAGICGLILSVNPDLNAVEVKKIVQDSARRIGNDSDYTNNHSVYFGFGCINAYEALKLALAKQKSKPKLLWGFERHKLIAKYADNLLTDSARIEIQKILSKINETSLDSIATWADDIKYNPDDIKDEDTIEFLAKYKKVHGSWHYVDIPIDATAYDRNKYAVFTKDDDVVQTTSECIMVLQKKSTKFSPLNALRWLTHLLGDIHQPIHVGCSYLFEKDGKTELVFDPEFIIKNKLEKNSDHGGNKLFLPINGYKKNLHSFWDTELPNMDKSASVNFPEQEKVDYNDLDKLPIKWASETLTQARVAYQSLKIIEKIIATDGKVSYKVSWDSEKEYVKRGVHIVKTQKELAASRLSFLLNSLYP